MDLVIASPSSDAVKALLPEVASQTAIGEGGPAELTDTIDTAGEAAGNGGVQQTNIDVNASSGITPDFATNVAR